MTEETLKSEPAEETAVRQEEQIGEQQEVSVEEIIETGEETLEAESPVAAAEPTAEEMLAAVQAQAAEYLDGWQRARAEFANARKRLERDRAQAYSNAAVDFAGKLLPVLDDYDRALTTVPADIEEDDWFQGLLLVYRKLMSVLEGLQVEPIDAMGQPFDPNLHEALSLKEADGVESGVVVEELQTGYRLGDRVIRPSLVNVSA